MIFFFFLFLKANIKYENLICAHCSGNSKSNQNGIPEPLSCCYQCGMALHTTCANITGKCKTPSQVLLYMLITKGSKWYCEKCRTCDTCDDTQKGPCLLCCNSCGKNFHLTCLNPVPDKKPKCPWR